MAKSDKNLLEGNLFLNLIKFALPLLLMNLLQRLYNAADMIVVGYSGVTGAIGAIGTTGSMINLFLNVFGGFAIGANVLVARYIGAKDPEKTRIALHTSVSCGALFGIASMILGFIFCKPLLKLMGNEGYVLELAGKYCMVYFVGIPAIALTAVFNSIFRAKGDTRTPLIVMSCSGLANVGLNLFTVLVLGMDVDGVAWATVLSNVISAVWMLFILMKDEGWCRFSFKWLTISKRSFRDLIGIGLPAAVQGSLFSVSNMMIQSSIVSLNNLYYPGGSAIIDGCAANSNIESMMYCSTMSTGQAMVTFTSQHLGAGMYDRLKKVRREGLKATVLITGIISGLFLLLRYPITRLYVQDEAALEAAFVRMFIMFPTYFLDSTMENMTQYLRGLGKSFVATLVTLVGVCGFRLLWIFLVFGKLSHTLETVFLSYPISWLMTTVAAYYLSNKETNRILARNNRLKEEKAP